MPRISISIPEELMAKLEPIKDTVNISQLCREALERRVAAFDRASDCDVLEIDGLVKRFREERDSEVNKYEELGKHNAGRWLNSVSYLELKNIAEKPNLAKMSKYHLPRAAFNTMKQDMADTNVGLEDGQAVAYKTAWLDYVRTVWAQVTEQLEQPNGLNHTPEPQPEEAI